MEESARGMGIEVPRPLLLRGEDSTHLFFHRLVELIDFSAQSQKPAPVRTGKLLCSFLFLLICSLACPLCPVGGSSLIALHPPAEMVKRKGGESRAGRERAASVVANWKPREQSQMEFSQFDPLNLQTTPTSPHIKSDLSCRNPRTTVGKWVLFSCLLTPPPPLPTSSSFPSLPHLHSSHQAGFNVAGVSE